MLAIKPNAVLSKMVDVVTLTELHNTHGISIDIINSVILMAHEHEPYIPFIYVVYNESQITQIINAEISNPDTDLSGFKMVDSLVNLADADLYYFEGMEEYSALPRDKFNLGISFIFILKHLTSPLIKY